MRPFPSVVLSCALALGVSAAVSTVSPADADDPAPGADRAPVSVLRGAGDRPDGRVLGTGRPQTSDGVVGPVAKPLPTWLRGATTSSRMSTHRVVPGVTVTEWDEGTARGPVRLQLMHVQWRTKGLTVDYADAGSVARTATLSSMLTRDGAVAGVNGDFFDIGRTGAPLGLGRDRDRGTLHGRATGWTSAFAFGKGGWPDIRSIATVGRVKEYPKVAITSFNSPSVEPGGIGRYTPGWGKASGYRWTDGQKKDVRVVQVVDGRVKWTGTRIIDGRAFQGTLLVGRGKGARALAAMKRGSRARVWTQVRDAPRMAITGNKFLVLDGTVDVVDDREMHPRTAIGIDRDTKSLLLLVVDGRQSFSRGYTMVELAEKMIDLGADEALNLDGGGSSTMLARRTDGTLGLVNSPSDGRQRSVANGIEIRYQKPR